MVSVPVWNVWHIMTQELSVSLSQGSRSFALQVSRFHSGRAPLSQNPYPEGLEIKFFQQILGALRGEVASVSATLWNHALNMLKLSVTQNATVFS